MQNNREFEKVIYHQKLAHKAWASRVVLRGFPPTDEESELVWELLVSYGEAIDSFEQYREDIYKTAQELAKLALSHLGIEDVYKIYRDYLLDAMMEFVSDNSPHQYKTLIRFANSISSAYCDVHSDLLKKTIRHSRAENVSQELKLAKKIQTHLLPKVLPVIPGFDFAGRLIPAAEVGGDYWSIKHYEDNGIVTMKLADISGHGVAAATLVAAVKFISGGYYQGAKSAAEVMEKTNRVLTKETPHDILVTMVYGWLNPEKYELAVVNAGHSPAFMCNGKVCTDILPTGPVLGITEVAQYSEKKFKLKKNEIIFFGSDGITEAGIGEQFGINRLKDLVTESAHLTADEIADKVVQTVIEYARVQHDDISILVTKVTGEPPEAD